MKKGKETRGRPGVAREDGVEWREAKGRPMVERVTHSMPNDLTFRLI